MQEFTARSEDAGVRLDLVVASKYPQFSRSSLETLFHMQMISVKDKPAKPSYKVHSGDAIKVDETYLKAMPPETELPVIYEDNNVIAIDKPAGILTHSKGALNTEPTVASFISSKINDETMTGNRAGIVHRLDRATSGVIIAAKNQSAMAFVQKQFAARKVIKNYMAVVNGKVEPQEAIIDAPIARNLKRPQTFTVSPLGKPAKTNYKVIKSFQKNNKHYSLVGLKPQTGRTHQLRVHMAYIRHPITGDILYGNGGDSLLLHAVSLELTLPNGTRKVFESPLPDRIRDFANI